MLLLQAWLVSRCQMFTVYDLTTIGSFVYAIVNITLVVINSGNVAMFSVLSLGFSVSEGVWQVSNLRLVYTIGSFLSRSVFLGPLSD